MVPETASQPAAVASTVPDFGGQHEAVGIFESYDALQAAVDELLTSGFARCELSLAARQTGDQAIEPAEMLADDPAAACGASRALRTTWRSL